MSPLLPKYLRLQETSVVFASPGSSPPPAPLPAFLRGATRPHSQPMGSREMDATQHVTQANWRFLGPEHWLDFRVGPSWAPWVKF